MKLFSGQSIGKFSKGLFYGALTSEGAGAVIALGVGDGWEGVLGALIHQPIVDITTAIASPIHNALTGIIAPSTSAGGFGW